MHGYITYDKYLEYGGNLDETAFSSYIYDVESKLNYLTNNRISRLTEIPESVYRLTIKLMSVYQANDATLNSGNTLTSYSNGIESFGYNVGEDSSKGSTSFDDRIYAIIKEYLSDHPELLYRGRKQWMQR